ncbi:MAG TPA: universal stress protein [Stellaceae bacterium]|nr:universal stress protein [Stellaceae bacterium]
MSKSLNNYNSFRHVLVCVDASPRSRSLVTLALSLARRHAARVTGLYVSHLSSPELFYCDPPAHAAARFIDEMTRQLHAKDTSEEAGLKQEFCSAAEKAGVEAGWCMVDGLSADALACHGPSVDLAICRQRDLEHIPFEYLTDVAPAMLRSLRRPVLVLPRTSGYSNASRKVLLDCRDAEQALRAFKQAIPLLERSAEVVLLSTADDMGPMREIAVHLARYAINASTVQSLGKNVATGLLDFAREFDADLIVSRDDGGSQMRTLMFGSVTQALLADMHIPVLLAA